MTIQQIYGFPQDQADFPPSLKCSGRAVAWPGVQGGTGRGREGVQRPLLPVVGETTKDSGQTFFYVSVAPKLLFGFVKCTTAPSGSSGPSSEAQREKLQTHDTGHRAASTLLLGLAVTQREFRQSEGTIPGDWRRAGLSLEPGEARLGQKTEELGRQLLKGADEVMSLRAERREGAILLTLKRPGGHQPLPL